MDSFGTKVMAAEGNVGGGGGFSKVVATFHYVWEYFDLFVATTGDVWIVPSLQIWDYCPACRTTLVATRFRVAVICPIIQMPHCIRVFFYFVWFVFINHIFHFYYELCTYCNILDIYLS